MPMAVVLRSTRMADSLAMAWIESAGGPLVVLPRSLRSAWMGVAADDYDAACSVDGYLGLLRRPWGDALVLGDEPLRTSVVQRHDGLAIVRWRFAPGTSALMDAARVANLDGRPAETIEVALLDGRRPSA